MPSNDIADIRAIFADIHLELVVYIILVSAAFMAGGLNAIAGGGTFLTFPALAFVGVPLIEKLSSGCCFYMDESDFQDC